MNSKTFTDPVDPDVIASGHLDVGEGHQIYWEEWGNPALPPIMFLHGGPGDGFGLSHKSIFSPTKHHVIFHDQRGCGHSLPYAEIEHNTTQDLIADIEKLRQHLKLNKVAVIGGSWGSTLGLLYTIAHPEQVTQLLIWSIYLARQAENDLLYTGYARHNFPEAWSKFISLVPAKNRKTGMEIIRYYSELLRSKNEVIAAQAAFQWISWECSLISLNYDPGKIEREAQADPNLKAEALMENNYFLHGCFIPENYILDQLHKIQQIPCAIVQGRFDFCTTPDTALELAEAYGANCTCQVVNSSHLRSEPEMLAALRATVNASF